MQYFVLTTLLVIMSVFHFTERPRILPPMANFLPEVLSGIVLLYVVFVGAKTRFRYVRGEYWLAFGAIAAVIICGIFANAVAPGPIFAGVRYYLRAIPMFFLPAVYPFSDKQKRQQLRWLAVLCVLQLPLAVHERLTVMEADRTSGDSVVGSLEQSGGLSFVLISAVCIVTAMSMRGLLSRKSFFALFIILLLPTTINETKATLILLPIGLLITALVAAPTGKRLRVLLFASALLAGFFAIFAPIYDYLERSDADPNRPSITSFFLNPQNIERYVGGHADQGSVHVGRLDALLVPLHYLEREPARFALGLGIGNASHSTLGEQFTGQYYVMFQKFVVMSSMTAFMLEIGILGTTLVFVLYWLIFRDSLFVARADSGIMGALAAAWCGVVAMTTVSMPYITAYTLPSLSFLFWYMSGLIAARRMVIARAAEPEPARIVAPVATRAPVLAARPRRATQAVRSR